MHDIFELAEVLGRKQSTEARHIYWTKLLKSLLQTIGAWNKIFMVLSQLMIVWVV